MKGISVLPWLLVAGMWGAAAWLWRSAPESMPVHWNFAGEPDRWGGRAEGLLGLPAILTVLLVGFQVIPRLDPGRNNWAQMRGAWSGFQAAFVLFMAGVYAAALGAFPMAETLPWLLGALFVALGAVMGKIRPNFFFGIRTPWTLTSKRAWTRTHRLGGFVFIAVGLVSIVAGILVPPAALIVDVGGILLGSAALAVYSWRVWLADPDRIAPAGTRPE